MQELFHNLPCLIFEYRVQKEGIKQFTFVGNNSSSILGVTPVALQGDFTNLNRIIFKDDLKGFEESCAISTNTKKDWNWEGRILSGGSLRWIEIQSRATQQGEDFFQKGIILDVTEKRIEQQDRESRYRSLVESLPLGIGIHVNGKLVVANAHAHKMMAAKPSELIGKSVLDFIHPDSKPLVIERSKRVLSGESVPVIEERFIRLDGEVIDVEVASVPATYKGESAVQFIVHDITESKRTKDEVKKNESYFTQLFNIIPMAVVRLDETGKVELVNQGFTEMFGYSLSELIGKNLNDFIVPDEFQNEGIDINNLIASNKILQREVVRKTKTKKLVNVILYGMPVRVEQKAIGIYGVYIDITERKNMEEELRVRNSELDNFVYKVSHDLRAPLSSILGLVNLSKYPDNPDNLLDYIKLIGDKVSGLDHFISDVLSHSKNLKMEVTIVPVNFKEILLRTISDLSYLQGASDVEFEIIGGESEFYSDHWRISEIFRNLVSNAIKYRQLSGANPYVKVEIRITDTTATIIFSDNGIGITKGNLEKIFEMFFRATEQSDGSGIGLYIVKNAVEKLKGRITVDSIVGKGTAIGMELPNLRNFTSL